MSNNLFAPLFLWIGAVAAWTYTDYYTTETEIFLFSGGQSTSTYNIKVYPTGSVTPTSTNISTTLASSTANVIGWSLTYPITLTELFLSPNASVCSAGSFGCGSPQTTTATPIIDTSYYAPLVISAPSSCTKTSFLYTTSQTVYPGSIGEDRSTELVDQATESSEALFITTYIYTLSTNLGGQAVTTTRCDVYLSDGAVLGLQSSDEAYYLSQCVDPRRDRKSVV